MSGNILSWALRNGLRRGLMGGSRRWMFVGAVAGVGKLLKIMARTRPEVVYREKLEPGQVMVIDHKKPPTRRRR